MGEGERYEEHAPPPELAPFVRTIWTYAALEPSDAVQRIAPDGCPELVVHLGRAYAEQDEAGAWRAQPTALFAGQMTRPLALRPTGPVELVAVRFHPDGARDWLGAPFASATDQRLDMTARTAGLVLPPNDPAGQAEAIAAFIGRGSDQWRLDPAVRAEVTAGEADQAPPPRSPAEQRALQRRFLDRVGVSPRTLRSVFRFRRVFDHALSPDAETVRWLEAGLDAGYFDQPQMARDFRRFLDCTAGDWAREQVELARAIASQTYKRGPLSHP